MSRYRIVKVMPCDAATYYQPQSRFMFIWWPLMSGLTPIQCDSIEDAEHAIKVASERYSGPQKIVVKEWQE